jgi:proliferating cell nuclear antigen
MSFTLKLENSRILKGIIETLASIIDETEFRVTPKEFTISAMDPSRICLLKLSIKKDDFDEYECSKESKVGLNLDDLDKILKRSTTNDTVTINFNEADQKIKIKMQREGASRTRTFSLALLDIDIEEIPMDNLLKIDYPSKWVIDTDFLVEALKDAEIYSEILNINANEGQGLIFSSSGLIGEMEYDLNEEDLIESQIQGSSSGAYSLTFLKAILKIASITEKLEIALKTDHPLKMNFDLLEGGKLSYFLAPRVEEGEFDDDDDMDEF